MTLPDINLGGILPAVVLCITGVIVMIVGLFLRWQRLAISTVISLAGILVAFAANAPLKTLNESAFAGMVALDSYAWFLNWVILFSAALTVLMSIKYLSDEGLDLYEYFVLLQFATAGMMFMVSGTHLLVIFVGLETLSISIYILAGGLPTRVESREAALKYLLLGAFSSGIFLYGAALLYGSAGSLALPGLANFLQSGELTVTAKVGMGLLLVGFAFKTAAVPFHMWTPDVYEGAPTPLTAYMAVGVKAAAFAAFVRVFFVALPELQANWVQILWVVAAITMILGNIAALVQENIKRMLAYSSIAHAGYILVGMVAGGESGASGVLYYLLAYTFTNLGAFGVVALVGRKGEANNMIEDYRGLAKAHPALAVAMAVFLFSLAGIPPTAGFVGKFSIFYSAVKAGYVWLVVIGVLTSAASVFYYFRVIMKMYMEAPEQEPTPLQFGAGTVIVLVVALVGVVYIGIFPKTYLDMALMSVQPLF